MQRRHFFKLAIGAAAAVSVGLRATFSAPAAFESALLFSPTEYVGEFVWSTVSSPAASELTLAELERVHAYLMAERF